LPGREKKVAEKDGKPKNWADIASQPSPIIGKKKGQEDDRWSGPVELFFRTSFKHVKLVLKQGILGDKEFG